jgi:transposase InsO family protein
MRFVLGQERPADVPEAVIVDKSSRRPESAPLRARIEEIAAIKRRYGYRRVYVRLRREGWEVNRKRVYRLYREAGLAVRRRKRKRIGLFERKPLPKPIAANVSWSMDFVADGLIDGRRSRCLTIEARISARRSCRCASARSRDPLTQLASAFSAPAAARFARG